MGRAMSRLFKVASFGALMGIVCTSHGAPMSQVQIPSGRFQMGCSVNDDQCAKDEGASGGMTVQVPAFKLDQREVTVAEYRQCMDAGVCSRPKDHERNQYCNHDAPGRDQHPENCVDWQQAVDYCGWVEKRLPREAEWEKAARAGSVSRYPWGETVSCKEAVLDEVSPAKSDREPDGCYTDATLPVMSRAANGWGLYDMHGNAGEWVANWYAPDAIGVYANGDLDYPADGRQKVVRGGSWDENRPNLRSSYRNVKPPVSGPTIYGSIGFRCASDYQGSGS